MQNQHNKEQVLKIALQLTSEFEGFSPTVYKCPAGFNTIGYGRNIEANPLSKDEEALLIDGKVSKEVALQWLKDTLSECYDNLNGLYWFDCLNDARAAAMVDMCYNLGFKGLMKFRNSINFLSQQNYNQASENLKLSRWYSQVKRRGIIITDIIKTGQVKV